MPTLLWIPSHTGIAGNEEADQAADLAHTATQHHPDRDNQERHQDPGLCPLQSQERSRVQSQGRPRPDPDLVPPSHGPKTHPTSHPQETRCADQEDPDPSLRLPLHTRRPKLPRLRVPASHPSTTSCDAPPSRLCGTT